MRLFDRKKSDASSSEKPSNTAPGDVFRSFLSTRRSSFRRSSPPSEEAPPPTYQQAASAGPAAFLAPAPQVAYPAPVRRETIRNVPVGLTDYSGLSKVDTLFLIDDSGSMIGTNWEQTSVALAAIVPICTAHDSDGVDVYFLNHPKSYKQIRSSEQFLKIVKQVTPFGVTPTGQRLGEILDAYMKLYRENNSIKPLNIIVITDGEPTDPSKLERCIVSCGKQLNQLRAPERQVGVQFFQVGGDEAAAEGLEMLDNALSELYRTRDMVDTISWKDMNGGNGLTADAILKVVMGAMDKSLDRKRR